MMLQKIKHFNYGMHCYGLLVTILGTLCCQVGAPKDIWHMCVAIIRLIQPT